MRALPTPPDIDVGALAPPAFLSPSRRDRRRARRRDLASRALSAGAQVVAPDGGRPGSLVAAGRSLVAPGRSARSRGAVWSIGSSWSVLSAYSVLSGGSAVSAASAGSVLSIGSAGSILSIGSVGSILSIGSIGSVGGVGALGRNNLDATAMRWVLTASTALAVAALVDGARRA